MMNAKYIISAIGCTADIWDGLVISLHFTGNVITYSDYVRWD